MSFPPPSPLRLVSWHAAATAALAWTLRAGPASAQGSATPPGDATPPGPRHAVGLQLIASNFDAGAAATYRLRLPGGTQLGLEARYLAVRDAFVDGYAAEGGSALAGSALALLPLLRTGPLELHLRLSAGVRALDVDRTTGPDRRSTTLLSEFGPVVNVRVAPALTVRTGWLSLTNVQVAPGGALDALGQVLLAGVVVPVSDGLQLHADFETGGLFGYDGDGGKYLVRGTLGARWVLGGAARSWLSF